MKFSKTKLANKTVLAAFCSLAFLPLSVNSQSLEQAVAHTLDTHPEIRAAFTRFKYNEKQVDQAKSGYLPTLDVTGGIGYEYTDSPSTADDPQNLTRQELGISLQQNLFKGFQTTNEVDRTKYATNAEQWRLQSLAEDIALEVTKVYVEMIRTEKLVGLSEKNLQSHLDIYEQIKQRTDSGFSSKADLSQINGRLANAQSNLIAAKNNYLDSKTKFYRVINQAPIGLTIPMPDSKMLPSNKEEGIEIALQFHPSIAASNNDIRSATAQYESSKSNYYPELNIEVDANFNNDIDGVEGENNDLTAMLRFSYNIFSGGKDKAYTKQSAYKINEAKALNMNTHREVEEGFVLAWNAFELLNLQKQYIQMHVIASKDTQADYKEQFKVGQRTLLDLLDTENELYLARKNFLDAEFSEITAQYRILHSMGVLLDSLRVTRPESWQGEEQFEGGVYHENN